MEDTGQGMEKNNTVIEKLVFQPAGDVQEALHYRRRGGKKRRDDSFSNKQK